MGKSRPDAALATLCLAALVACDSGQDGPVHDAESPLAGDAAQQLDAQPAQDAAPRLDGSAHDAALEPGNLDGGSDAQTTDASAPVPSQRERICGATTSFPAPLPTLA